MTLPSASTLFWVIAVLMTAVALAFVLPALFSPGTESDGPSTLATNVLVYRSRLADLDRDLAAGRLPFAEHEQARSELGRQMLADAMDDAADANSRPTRRLALVLTIALPLLTLELYALLGDPDTLSANAGLSAFEATDPVLAPALRDNLVRRLARNPRDGRAWVLLARMDLEAERYADAAAAYEKAIAASSKVANDPSIWCEYADALGMAQGGMLAGKPRELVMRALTLNPAHPKALEMAGSAAFEAQDFATAARYWRELLTLLPERTRARDELALAVARADELAAHAAAPTRTPASGR